MSTLFYYKLPLEQSVSNILLCLHCSITNSPQSNLSAIYYYVYIVLLQTPLRAICQQYITMSTLFYYKLPIEQSVSNILLCLHCSITNSHRAICQQYITMSTLFYYKLPLEQSVSNILLCLHCSITNSPSICQQYITMSTLFYYKLPFNLSAIYYYVYIVLLQIPLRAICQQYIYVYIVLLQTPLRAFCQQYITMSTLFYYKLPSEQSVSNILLCLHCSITNSP